MAPAGPPAVKDPKNYPNTHAEKMLTYSRCFLPCSVFSCQRQPWHLGDEKMWCLCWALVRVCVCMC